jgi:hypothetical protein
MARKTEGVCNAGTLPGTIDGLRQLRAERQSEVEQECSKLMKRKTAIGESLVSGKTRAGKPLTAQGRRTLVNKLEGIHIEVTLLLMEGDSLAKRAALERDNDRWELLRASVG